MASPSLVQGIPTVVMPKHLNTYLVSLETPCYKAFQAR